MSFDVILRRFRGDTRRHRGLSQQQSIFMAAASLTPEEERQLHDIIHARYIDAYQERIRQDLDSHNLRLPAQKPRGSELRAIKRMVKRDLKSIKATYERDLINFIKQFPDGLSRRDAKGILQPWISRRWQTKITQVVAASRGNGAEFAHRQFIEKNKLQDGTFIWNANPPIVANSHKECVARVRQGEVPWDVARHWRRVHPNCRHVVGEVKRGTIKGKKVWAG